MRHNAIYLIMSNLESHFDKKVILVIVFSVNSYYKKINTPIIIFCYNRFFYNNILKKCPLCQLENNDDSQKKGALNAPLSIQKKN